MNAPLPATQPAADMDRATASYRDNPCLEPVEGNTLGVVSR
jgi:hypothetical protein